MTSTELRMRIEELKSQSPAQRERKRHSLAVERKQLEEQWRQLKLDEQALHAIENNNPFAANRFAVLATIDDDDDGVDEDEMDKLVAEVREDEQQYSLENDEDNVAIIEQEDGELIEEVQEDEQRDEQRPPPTGTHYVNGQLQFMDHRGTQGPPAPAQGPPLPQHQAAPPEQYT